MSIDDLLQTVPTFALVLFRVAGMMLFAPLFGSARIPRRIKALLVIILALGLVPGVPRPVEMPESMWQLALGIGGELIFGLAMGMVLSFTFIAAQWAGEMIGQQMGLNLSEVFDPQFGAQGSIVGEFYFMLTLVIFLAVGGHHAMIRAVRASFDALPLLSVGMTHPLLDTLTGLHPVGGDAGDPARRAGLRHRCSSWTSPWGSSARRCRS
jgi:flagellar biosynthetic protein FliR